MHSSASARSLRRSQRRACVPFPAGWNFERSALKTWTARAACTNVHANADATPCGFRRWCAPQQAFEQACSALASGSERDGGDASTSWEDSRGGRGQRHSMWAADGSLNEKRCYSDLERDIRWEDVAQSGRSLMLPAPSPPSLDASNIYCPTQAVRGGDPGTDGRHKSRKQRAQKVPCRGKFLSSCYGRRFPTHAKLSDVGARAGGSKRKLPNAALRLQKSESRCKHPWMVRRSALSCHTLLLLLPRARTPLLINSVSWPQFSALIVRRAPFTYASQKPKLQRRSTLA